MGFSSFQVASSGMKANQENMAVIGNNIANVNTDGFKASNYQFKDVLSQEINSPNVQSINVNELGYGVKGITSNNMSQGTLQPGASNKDMAIDGSGFFIVANGNSTEYTRTGSFRPLEFGDKIVLGDGQTGYILQGWNATYPFENEAPNIETTESPKNIELGLGTLERGRASNFVTITGNLNADEYFGSTENIITSVPLTNGTSPITGATDLKDVVDPAALNSNLFPAINTQNGTITLKATKGQVAIEETFTYGKDGTTVGDFMTWAQKALGISAPTSADAVFAPGGITLDANGVITFASGTGGNQQINKISLAYRNDSEASNLLQFTPVLTNESPKVSHHGMKVLDEDGNEHTLDITFTKYEADATGTTWSYNIESADNFKTKGERLVASGTIKFDLNGNQIAFSPNLASYSYVGSDGANKTQFINLDLSQMTQLSSPLGSDINSTDDGFPKGTLVDYYIGDEGQIIGKFDSGHSEVIAKIALASFMNSENLTRSESGNWQTFNAAQEVTISESGKTKAGFIRSNFIEQSNVDLTNEFAKLIVAQRSFQSASNALQVSNEILRNLASLGL